MKSCLKTLAEIGANNVIQNVTFLGAAIDLPDKVKTRRKMASVFSSTISGELKNVYTQKDLILILYACGQLDFAMGRYECFAEQ